MRVRRRSEPRNRDERRKLRRGSWRRYRDCKRTETVYGTGYEESNSSIKPCPYFSGHAVCNSIVIGVSICAQSVHETIWVVRIKFFSHEMSRPKTIYRLRDLLDQTKIKQFFIKVHAFLILILSELLCCHVFNVSLLEPNAIYEILNPVPNVHCLFF